MKPSARIQAVLDLLAEFKETSKPADVITSNFFRTRRYIGSKDRAEISKFFWDFMRNKARLEWHLVKVGYSISIRSAFIAYLKLVQQKTYAEIHQLFDGDKYAPTKLTKADTNLIDHLDKISLAHDEMPQDVKLEIPAWAFSHFKNRFGDNIEAEARAFQQPAPLDLRVNTLKTDRDTVLAQLSKEGWNIVATDYSQTGLRLKNRPNIAAHELFRDGHVEVQDEGSQLIAEISAPKPGDQVIDFCAGAGGKTLALSAMMKNKGRIVAGDVHGGRLRRTKDRLKRADIHNVETRIWLESADKWRKRHKSKFDVVLVDAPCSGSGTWRRNPDAKWTGSKEMLDELIVKQRNILADAAKLVKSGGKLVYATCSVFDIENDLQVKNFLEAHEDFALVPIDKDYADKETGMMKLTPAQNGTDGFFTAQFVRK